MIFQETDRKINETSTNGPITEWREGECVGVRIATPTNQPGNQRQMARYKANLLMRHLDLPTIESPRELRQWETGRGIERQEYSEI